MRYIVLREQDYIDRECLAKRIDFSLEKIDDLLKRLLDLEIVKCVNTSLVPPSKTKMFKLNFVGVILVESVAIYCAPKYMQSDVSLQDMRNVMRALRHYEFDSEDLDISIELEANVYNHISTILSLLFDYEEHGLYLTSEKRYEMNGRGSIDWNRTISHHLPVVFDGIPIYLDYEARESIDDASDYITRLHQAVLTCCSLELENAGLLDIFGLSPICLSEKPFEDFGDIEYVLQKISQRMSGEFVTWRMGVLKLLYSYIDNSLNPLNNIQLVYYGTCSFYSVWEKSCKVAFSDMLKKRLEDLPISLSKNWTKRSQSTLLDVIPSPKWRLSSLNGEELQCDSVGTLIPDIVVVSEDSKGLKEFSIYDAKYYNPVFNKRLSNVPGVESIAKQFLYQSAYRDFILDNHFDVVKNAFLFPTSENSFSRIGDVTFEIIETGGPPFSSAVDIIFAPADLILSCYISQKSLTMAEMTFSGFR